MTARRGRHIFLHNAIEEPVPRQRITGLEGTIVLLYAHSIDVQKMNWKVRTGVQEQTGVCLHRHCDHHGTGGYTHEPQNTGQCCDCQSLTCQVAPGLSKTMCGWYDGSRCCSTSWCTRCLWRSCASAGVSVPPVSTPGSGPFCCTAWRVCATAIAEGADRSGPPGRKTV